MILHRPAWLRLRPGGAAFRQERAQGLIEFAMITPFVLMFMFIIVDFGIGLNHRVVVTNDAREGARFAATGRTASDVKQLVQDQSEGTVKDAFASNCGDTGDKPCVDVAYYDTDSTAGLNPGDSVSVTIRYAYKILTPMPAIVKGVPSSYEMDACATMRLEQLPSPVPTATAGTPCS